MACAARTAVRSLVGDVDPRLLPVLPITFIYCASFSTFWVYVGVFAVRGLDWRPGEVGVLFLACAPPAAIANYLSGQLSDCVGRKWPIVASFLTASVTIWALAVLGHQRAFAFALIVLLGVVGAPAYTLDRVLVADLVGEERRREGGYAAVRVATNMGALSGPPLGALLIAVGGWTAFLLAIGALGIVGACVSAARLPSVTAGATSIHQGALRRVLADRPFLLLLLSTLLGYTIWCGFETVLPVIAVSTYRITPATWGLLVIISPLLVIGLQLRLTSATAHLKAARRLGIAILVMGLPFVALIGSASIPVIAAVMVVFVFGEMLWMPTSQAAAAQLAPASARGSYLGALAAMTGPAWTLTPFIAMTLRTHAGVASIWILLAGVALAGAAAGVAALAAARGPALAN